MDLTSLLVSSRALTLDTGKGTRRAHERQNRHELTRSSENRNRRSAVLFENTAGSRTPRSSSSTTGDYGSWTPFIAASPVVGDEAEC